MKKKVFNQLDLAKRGNTEAQYLLARHCFTSPDQDMDEAVLWAIKAAKQDHFEAIVLLIDIYLNNRAPGYVPQQAVGLLKQLIIMHDPNVTEERLACASARIKLGTIFCKGDLADLNLRAGQKLIKIGVEQFVGEEDVAQTEFPLLCSDLTRLYWNAKKVIRGGITGDPIEDNQECIKYCKMALKYGIPEQHKSRLEKLIDLAKQQNEEILKLNADKLIKGISGLPNAPADANSPAISAG